MTVEQGQSAFITGGASGIGRALAVALACRGVHVTILDLNSDQGEEAVRLVEEEHARLSYKPSSPSAIFIRCDVTKSDELAAAFTRHHDVFGRLHICINSAGILTGAQPFHEHEEAWRKVIDLNLVAVINGTCKAIQAMKDHGGLILNISSVYAYVPSLNDPIYATSKAGVAMFTRSLATVGMGIRVNALCPEFVETPLFSGVPSFFLDYLRDKVGLVEMEKVVAAAFSIFDDENKVGECLSVPANRPTEVWPDEESKRKNQIFKKDGSIFAAGDFD
ncbi:hypothetical protein KC19_2G217300 [Ceratodon purpureus]|uniref:15-hydroxyprostaglandin dehydrogenase n=1 Tax=Ceratodon purpureus TaxID=3225 RepID=A0A8T0IYZ3_CERPU|nr:hypothetical protein KC19_2G217300 [Ceratodon purpureus]